MAARRLLLAMIAVLIVSTIGAALIAPRPTPPSETEATTTTSTQRPEAGHSGRLIEKSVQQTSRRPEVVPIRVGDQIELTVRTRIPAQVEIARLGMVENATPDAPAHFSVLPAEPGRYAVRLAGGRTVAIIRVSD
jgi:hypothetical protein